MAALQKLTRMRDMEIQDWLRKIDPDDLKIAMTQMDSATRASVLRNMSARAGETLNAFLRERRAIPTATLTASCRNVERALD
jgi:flagellar motor switch protein FliG